MHALVAAQARRTPGRPPARGRAHLSYRELEEGANRLAHRLRAAGVGRDVPVALCLPRSPELVVAMLAVLKAGGAYVPLDPAYPAPRLAFMLADTSAPVLITTEALAPMLPPGPQTVLLLDRAETELAPYPAHDPGAEVRTGDLAYVIYTSGSTGTPKGVVATHRGAVNRIRWMQEACPFEPGEVCCQKTPVSFVDSVWEIFGPRERCAARHRPGRERAGSLPAHRRARAPPRDADRSRALAPPCAPRNGRSPRRAPAAAPPLDVER